MTNQLRVKIRNFGSRKQVQQILNHKLASRSGKLSMKIEDVTSLVLDEIY